jgi:hypothetical protein
MHPLKYSTNRPNARASEEGEAYALRPELGPISTESVIQRARTAALNAIAAGWKSPYDPLSLAEHLNLEFTPRDDIRAARIVTTDSTGPRIEFNPNQPRKQMCHSVAIEISRVLLFGSHATHHESAEASWQIETLCHIAATEFLIPVGSLSLPEIVPPSLGFALNLEQRLDVPIEALLNRVALASTGPCAMFCASRVEGEGSQGHYRVDYTINSTSWPMQIPNGLILSSDSVVVGCNAIGLIAQNTEQWLPDRPLLVECIGVSSLPGSTYPRVVGLVRVAADA